MINNNPADLYPPFALKVARFVSEWNEANPIQPIGIFEGFRSFDRQSDLYAQGRTKVGPVVTNAMPGFSWHQYGFAADLVFDADPVKPGLQASWDGKFPWAKMGKMAQEHELEWAGAWKYMREYPHVQDTRGMQLVEARELYARGGLKGVWAAIS